MHGVPCVLVVVAQVVIGHAIHAKEETATWWSVMVALDVREVGAFGVWK
ncbi:MAG: hypothetical protein QW506_06015 [Thermoproteota archaeon]